jgi:hypothetical protein
VLIINITRMEARKTPKNNLFSLIKQKFSEIRRLFPVPRVASPTMRNGAGTVECQ